jgi:hypothetical protein
VSTLPPSQTWCLGPARVFCRVESVGKFRSLCGIWRFWQPVSDAFCGIGKRSDFYARFVVSAGVVWIFSHPVRFTVVAYG